MHPSFVREVSIELMMETCVFCITLVRAPKFLYFISRHFDMRDNLQKDLYNPDVLLKFNRGENQVVCF